MKKNSVILQKLQDHKRQRLKNCTRLTETKETLQLNAICDPGLDSGLRKKFFSFIVKDIIEQLKLYCGYIRGVIVFRN